MPYAVCNAGYFEVEIASALGGGGGGGGEAFVSVGFVERGYPAHRHPGWE